MAAILHGRNNENVLHMQEHFFPIGKRIYCSAAMQYGCRAKPGCLVKQIKI